jgi:AcrR family transcriptional regulator
MSQAAEAEVVSRIERRRSRSRAVLVDAAIELFQEKGFRGTTLQEICERADVASRTFFNHFETREHLYQAIAHQRAVQFAELLDAVRGDPRPLAQRLNDFFAVMGAYLVARPLWRELVGEMLHLRLRHEGSSEAVRSGVLGQAALRFVRDGVRRGEITRRHRPEVLADIFLGAQAIALSNWCAGDDYDLEAGLGDAARALLDLFAPAAGNSGAANANDKKRRR